MTDSVIMMIDGQAHDSVNFEPTANPVAQGVAMWLIQRNTDGRSGGRIALPATLLDALTRWYTGRGTSADEAAGITLVQQARVGAKWLACSCRGRDAAPPILTPAYLSEAETYYLRRLTAAKRPVHRADCPFFRDQATARVNESSRRAPPSAPPAGFFEALRPAPEKLAQRPVNDEVDDRTRHAPLPRLARLMRRLLMLSGRTVLPLDGVERSIATEFHAIRGAAARMTVAPDIELDRVLWTHAAALREGRIARALEALAPRWPHGHAPQGFLLLYARQIRGHFIIPADGDPVRIANRVQAPAIGIRSLSGPFLVLVVVGKYPEAQGFAPLRAYAQPIFSGAAFLPIDADFERRLIRALSRHRLSVAPDVHVSVQKPVFDLSTPAGECRPGLIVEMQRTTTGSQKVIVQLSTALGGAAGPARALHSLAPVLFVSQTDSAALIASRTLEMLAPGRNVS